MAFELPIDLVIAGGKTAKQTAFDTVCNTNIMSVFYWFFLPLLIGLMILLLIKYKSYIMLNVFKIYAKSGYIRVWLILENRRIKSKLVKLDKFNNFVIKNRRYSLEKMYDFLLGYDKYGFPTFLYDYQFILPLYITKQKITSAIKDQLGEDIDTKSKDKNGEKDLKLYNNLISAIIMKLDSSILQTVYTKKLISDLYSISGDIDFKKKIVYVIIGIVLLIFLYYTGYLEILLSYVGLEMPQTTTTTTTGGSTP